MKARCFGRLQGAPCVHNFRIYAGCLVRCSAGNSEAVVLLGVCFSGEVSRRWSQIRVSDRVAERAWGVRPSFRASCKCCPWRASNKIGGDVSVVLGDHELHQPPQRVRVYSKHHGLTADSRQRGTLSGRCPTGRCRALSGYRSRAVRHHRSRSGEALALSIVRQHLLHRPYHGRCSPAPRPNARQRCRHLDRSKLMRNTCGVFPPKAG